MSLKYNYYTFTNVQTIEDVLGNIKQAATAEGWVIDKDDIANNQELYLHNLGNGSQNLYFSLKGVVTSTFQRTNNVTRIFVIGNTGFDTSLTSYDQPGRFSPILSNPLTTTNGAVSDIIIQFPVTNQYILCNNTNLLSIMRFNSNGFHNQTSTYGLLPHLFLGSIDSYKGGDETEGNICVSSPYYYYIYSEDNICDGYFNINPYSGSGNFGLYYNNIGQPVSNIVGNMQIIYLWYWNGDALLSSSDSNGHQYPHYNNMVKYNTTTSRTTLIKPVISLKYSTSTDTYFYPIGELPYYACKVYPYSKAGDLITAGTRNFRVFPLLNYTDANGVAFEVN